MLGSEPRYDIALTTFSPDGRLFQVEYAYEAVRKGTPIIGIRGVDGVILAVSLRRQPLQEPSKNDKLFQIDDAIGAAIAGLSADARTLIAHARVQAQVHRLTFDEPIPIRSLSKKIGDHVQTYTQYGGVRPFGVSMLLIGVDSGPQLYLNTPIGAYWSFKAHAVGMEADKMNLILEETYSPQLTVEDALTLAVEVHKEVARVPLTPENLVMAKITTTEKRFTWLDAQMVQALIDTN